MFEILITNQVGEKLAEFKTDKGLSKRYKAVSKAIKLLSENPRHPSLMTHEFTSLKGPHGEKVFETHAEHSMPAAYRIFWCHGPEPQQITIVSITPHP